VVHEQRRFRRRPIGAEQRSLHNNVLGRRFSIGFFDRARDRVATQEKNVFLDG